MTALARAARVLRDDGAPAPLAQRLAKIAVRAKRRGPAGRVAAAREIADALGVAERRGRR